MDPERPHRSTSINNSSSSTNTTSTTSELFICFTSRLSSSSSMKISSKSILSPGRAREPSQISLSSSLSRRLRINGSMKGGQASPMFPTNGKKRGCAFENPEPSSPKVTCIGQVRVKTKKQSKKFRVYRSKRRGEVSFRKVDHNNVKNGNNSLDNTSSCQDYNMGHFLSNNSHHHQQQHHHQECKKWVHLPLTICEALRAFGAEFNCFLPCRPSCMANQRDKEEKTGGSGRESNNGNGNENESSCGSVFARWLVAVQDGEGKGREIELVVGGEDDDDERRESSEIMMRSSRRRHVFEDIEINDCGDEKVADEEEARVSICIPPKNALLLMRCRSDPVKMAALANRFWEAPMPNDEKEEAENERKEKEEEEKEEEEAQKDVVKVESEERQVTFEQEIECQEVSEVSEMFVSCEATQEQEAPEAEAETEAESSFVGDEAEVVVEESLKRSLKKETIIQWQNQENENEVEEDHQESMVTEETFAEASLDLEKLQREENVPDIEQEAEDSLDEEVPQQEEEEKTEAKAEEECEENEKKQEEEEEEEKEIEYQAIAEESEEEEEGELGAVEKQEAEATQERSELECPETREPDPGESKESEYQQNLLPDCLLLMMCEPKLAMEVSKETWVCSTDFIRWVPERKKQQPAVKLKDGGDEPKRRISIDSNKPPPFLLQPPRSSCSFPAAPPMATAAAANGPGGGGSMATVIEQKLAGDNGYEPFELTRCKSEPMRSSAKLAPDACFWKNRKLEPATVGVGAAGVGF